MAARRKRRPAFRAGLATIMLYPHPVLADGTDLPAGGQVTAGAATITSAAGQMLVNQSSSRAVIDWSSFNIGQQSGVTFDMPGTSAAILNRVTGATPSTIAGNLTANGQVFLVNPNGIAITSSGAVKVGGGFTASTLDLRNEDFLQGRLAFSGTSPASITQAGRIEAGEGGFAALIARGGIENSGLISVPAGRVALGTGSAITLDPTGTGFMQILAPLPEGDGGTVRSSGRIIAEGGRVEIKAASAAKAIRDIVNVSGEVSVASVRKQGGTIILDGGSSGLRLSAKLNASSRQAKGGNVAVGGKRIALEGSGIDVKGTSGGVVSIGGGRQGAPVPGSTTASAVSIDSTSIIDASALAESGGEITVWSDDDTRFRGNIVATGASGDGGAAEVSSLGAYEFSGRVNLLSAEGRAGQLLLDPYDVVISTGADANQSGFTATGTGAVINTASLEAALAGASVTVLTGSSGSETGTITVESPISWSANTTLTLDAAGNILLNGSITTSGTGSGITLTAAGAGGISGSGNIASNGTLTFNVNTAAATGTHTGVISGTGQLVKGGAGLLTLSGANSYTGNTTISAGTLRAGSSLALGVTTYTVVSGTFDMAGYAADIGGVAGMGLITNSGAAATLTLGRGTISRAFGGTIEDGAGAISIVKTGTAVQTLDGLNRFTGSITIDTGTFQIRGADGLNSGNYAGNIFISPAGSLRYSSGTSQTFSGAISGVGTLAKDTGTSVLTLSNASGFTGPLNITAGTLRAGSANGFGSAVVFVGSGATLDLAGFSIATGSIAGAGTITNSGSAATLSAGRLNTSTTFSGILQNGAGTLSLTKTGTGTLTLSGANTYTGQTTISAGTVALSGSGVIVSDIDVGASGWLSFSRTPFTYAGVISGTGNLNFSNGMTFTGNNTFTGNGQVCTGCTINVGNGGTSGTLNASLFFYAGTSLVFNRSDTSTFSGSITGNAAIIKNGPGTLIVTGSIATPTATINAGTLQIGDGGTTGSISNPFTNNSALVFNRSDALTYAGAISGTGSLTKLGAGTLTLTGANTYSGDTTISGGTLQIGSGGTTGSIGGNIVNNAALTFNRSDALISAGSISGTGSLTKLGAGTLTLSGSNTYTGATTISAGTVRAGSTSALGSNSAVQLDATLDLGGFSQALGYLSGSATGTVTNSGAAATLTAGANTTADAIFSGRIQDGAGAISVIKVGTKYWNLKGANTYTGGTTISLGSLIIDESGTIAGNIVNNGGLGFNSFSATTAYAGNISGTGFVSKWGTAVLTLSGTNTYTGGTQISMGTVRAGSASALGSNPSVELVGGATIDLAGFSQTFGDLYGAGTITNSGAAATLTMGTLNTSTTFSGILQNGTGTLALVKAGTGTFTLSGASTYTGGTTISAGTLQIGAGSTTGSITGNILNNSVLTFNRSDAVTYAGAVSGTGSLTKLGAGTLTLTGANTYSGDTTISGGTLQIGSGGTTGSIGGNIVNNAAVTFNRSDALTSAGSISGTGSLTKLGAGTLTLSGNNTYTGATTISAGTVRAGSTSALGSNSAVQLSATLDLAGYSQTIGYVFGGGTVTNSGTAATFTTGTNTSATNPIFDGSIQDGAGAISVVKVGSAAWSLRGANTYSGGTTISAGTLQIADSGSIAGHITNNDTLIFNSFSAASNHANTISGTGILRKYGTAILTLSGANSYTGATQIQMGTLRAGSASSLGSNSAVDVTSGATLDLAGFSNTIGSLTNTGTVTNSGAAATLSVGTLNTNATFSGILQDGAGPLALVKVGTGTLILAGTNTYTGGTTISAGTLQIGAGSTTGSITGNILNNSALAFNRSDALTYGDVISGTGSLTKLAAGTLTLTGENTYSGGTTITAGTLQLGNGGTTGMVSGNIVNNSVLTFSRSDALTYGNVVSGTGSLTQAGTGTLTLTGNNTYTGVTTINAARSLRIGNGGTTGVVTGNITNNGTLAFNRSNALTYAGVISGTGSFTQSGTGTLTLSTAHSFTGVTTVDSGSTLQFGIGGSTGSVAGSIVNNGLVVLNHSVSYTYYTAISGSGALTKIGPNHLIFNDLAYTGVTTISAGTLQLGNGGTTGSVAGDIVNNSTLVFNRSDSVTYSGAISGTGSFTKLGAGTLTLSGSNTHTGPITVSAGTLKAGSASAFGSNSAFTVSSGAIADLGGFSNSIGSLSGGGTVTTSGAAATLTAGGLNTGTIFSGVMQDGTGTLSLVKTGTGTLTLSGANTHTGTTTVSAGTLLVGAGGTTGSVAGNIINNAILSFNRSDALTYGGVISGTGSLTQVGLGTLVLTADSPYSGGTTIAAGTLQLGNGGTTGMVSGNIVNNSVLTFNRSDALTYGNVVSGTGSLTQAGTGTLTLTGNNTYTGFTTIDAARSLQIGDGGTTGSVSGYIANNGMLAFNRSDALTYAGVISGTGSFTQRGTGTLTLSMPHTYTGGTTVSPGSTLQLGIGGNAGSVTGSIVNNGLVVLNHSINYTFGSPISGSGALTKIGPNTLIFNDLTYTGVTTISAGTLQLGSGGTTGSVAGDIVNNSTLVFNRSDAVTYGGVISGTGSLTQLGAGTLTLTAESMYSGGTTISAGTLQLGNGGTTGMVSGNIINNSALVFNRSDALNYGNVVSGTGSLTQAGTGTLTLTGNNTYTGVTTINATRVLQVGSGGTAGSVAGNIGNAGTLIFNRSDNFTEARSLSGAVVKMGTGTMTYTANSGTPNFTISEGTLQFGDGGTVCCITPGFVNNAALIFNHSNGYVYLGDISGTGSLTKLGAGMLTLSGANTYSGGTTISAGTLQIGAGTTTGTIPGDITNNSALVFNRSDALTYGGVVSGAGTLTKLGAGTLTLTGTNTHTGGTTISAGTLQLGNGGTTGMVPGNIINNSALVFNRSDALNYGNVVSGTGSLTQAGSGALTLTGNNTYTGVTTINATRVLQVGSGGTAGSVAGNIGNAGTLIFNRSDNFTEARSLSGAVVKMGTGTMTYTANSGTPNFTISEGTLQFGDGGTVCCITPGFVNNAALIFNHSNGYQYNGTISGTGSFTKSGAGTLLMTGANSYTGTTTIAGGMLTVFSPGAATGLSQSAGLTVNGTLDLGGNSTSIASLAGSGIVANNGMAATLTAGGNGASTTFSGVLQNGTGVLSLTKTGTGTLTLTGTNTYTGSTTISAGTLQLGSGGTTGSIASDIVNDGALTFNRSDALTYGGVISGTGAVTKLGAGTLILSGNNTHTGGTTISAGTLQLGNGGTAGSITGNITNNGALMVNRSDALTYGGVISGTGSLTTLGAGTLILTGASTYTGATTVNAGSTLQFGSGGAALGSIAGSITNNGTVILDTTTHGNFYTVMTGSGSFIKRGSATMYAVNNHQYTGDMTVEKGMLWFVSGLPQGNMIIGSTGQVDVQLPSSMTYNGIISGSGTLGKRGAGTLTLTANSPFAGAILVLGGNVQIGNGGTGGNIAGPIAFSGGNFLTFDRSDDFTFAGTVTGGSLVKNGAGTMVATGVLSPTSTTISGGTLQIGDGGTTGSISNIITNNSALVFNRSDALTYAGAISGTGSLTKLGLGTLTLSGTNTHTGGTIISAGTLQIGAGGTTGSIASNILNNSALAFNRSDAVTYGYVISGPGSLTKLGTGTLTLTGANTHTGTTTVSSGVLDVNGDFAGNIVNNASLSFGGGNATFAGSMSGIGSFQVSKTGILTLTNDNAIGAATTVFAYGSTISVGNGGTSGNFAGTVRFVYGGTLIFNRSDTFTFGGSAWGGVNTTIKEGAGTMIMTGSFSGSVSGPNTTIINAGTLQIGNGSTTGSIAGNIVNNSALDFNVPGALTFGGIISGAGPVMKSGTGTLTLTGSNSYTGPIIVSAGTLKAGSATAFGSNSALTVASGAVADLNGFSTSIGSLSGGGTVTNSGAAAALTEGGLNATTTFSGVLQNGSGVLSLVKTGTGTLILTGASTYTGGTTVNAGSTLQMGNGGSTGNLSGSIANSGSVVLNTSYSGWVNGFTIGGTGSFTKLGPGSVLTTSNHTYTGDTTVRAGELWFVNVLPKGNLNVEAGAFIFQPGTGSFTYAGTVTGGGSIRSYTNGMLAFTADSPFTGSLQAVSGNIQFGNGGTSGNMAGSVTLTAGTFLTFDRSDDFTYSGSLSGGSLVKNGLGRLIATGSLSNAVINAGTLQIGNGGTTGSIGGSIANNAALVFNRSGALNQAGSISGTGSLTQAGSGALTLSGANTYTGATGVIAGTLKAGSATAFGSNSALTVSSGAVADLNGFSASIGSLSGGGTVTNAGAAATLTTGGNNTSTTFSGILRNGAGVLSLVKTGTGTLTLSGDNTHTGLTVINAGSLALAGSWNAGATAALQIANSASIFGNGTLTAGTLSIGGEGSATLTGSNRIGTLASSSAVGSLSLNNAQSLTLASVQARGAVNITVSGAASDLTIGQGAVVSSDAAGDAVSLSSARYFINASGAGAVSTPNGRWLVYLPTPAGSNFNGLNSSNAAIWNTASGAAVAGQGQRYVFAARPTLAITSLDLAKTYGGDVTSHLAAAYRVTGFDPGVAGAYLADSEATVLSGAPAVLSAGAGSAAPTGTYQIDIAQGTLTSLTGYELAFSSAGLLTVNRAGLTVRARDAAKTYDGLAFSGGTGVTYEGLVNGDTEAVLSGSLAYGGAAQGAVNAGTYGLTVSGLTSGNYDISYADGLLTVNRAGLTVRARDAAKTYDGLAFSGGTGVTYEGLVNGETEAVLSGSLAYGGAAQGAVNAGTYGLTVSGLTSGNYDINYADGLLTVNRAALTVRARDAAKTYDGLAFSGGTGVTYEGLVNGETEAVLSGSLAYGGAAQGAVNAGTYGLTVSGLTSGNYDVSFLPGLLVIEPAASPEPQPWVEPVGAVRIDPGWMGLVTRNACCLDLPRMRYAQEWLPDTNIIAPWLIQPIQEMTERY